MKDLIFICIEITDAKQIQNEITKEIQHMITKKSEQDLEKLRELHNNLAEVNGHISDLEDAMIAAIQDSSLVNIVEYFKKREKNKNNS
jgi:hypothetical protein